MPKTHKNLYSQIYDYDNLYTSFKTASARKTTNPEVLRFEWRLEENLINIQNHLIYKSWKPLGYRKFVVYEPKRREIAAPQFADRIVHHALCRIIEPKFETRFLDCSYACRHGRGTHLAVETAQTYVRNASLQYIAPYIFKGDISKYFYSVPHEKLKEQYRRTIGCKDTLWLMDTILESGGNSGVGIPIGSLTSQLYANIMLDPLDHFAKEQLRIKRYLRYMDDFIAIAQDKSEAREYWWKLQNYIEFNLGLKLNPKSDIQPLSKGLNFCGYRIWPGFRLPRKRNIRRMKKRIGKMVMLCKNHRCTPEAIKQSWSSFCGYMRHCNSHTTMLHIHNDIKKLIKEDL